MNVTKRTAIVRNGWRWILVIAWCGAIFYLSHQPRTALPRAKAHVDYEPAAFDAWLGQWGIDRDVVIKKGSHLVGYAVLALLVYSAGGNVHQAFWMALLYAVLDELHQGMVPGRSSSLTDVLLDAVGAAAVLLTWSLLGRIGRALRLSP